MPVKVEAKNFLYIIIITTIVISTRLLIAKQLHTIYFVDSYYYMMQAIDVSKGNFISFSERGFPFIYFLGMFIRFLSPIMGPEDASKVFLIMTNLLLFCVIYLIWKLMMNETLSFFATIFSIFEISLLEYSLVPYMELFALSFAYSSLLFFFNYFKTSNLKSLLYSFMMLILSGFTRYEVFVTFGFPIFFVILIRSFVSGKQRDKKIGFIIICSSVLFMLAFWQNFMSYYFSTTRFDPFTKILLGLRSDVITNVFKSIFAVTGVEKLDFFYMLISILSIVATASSSLFSLNNKSFVGWKRNIRIWIKELFNDNKKTVLLTYALIVISECLVLIAYGYSYTITDSSIKVSVSSLSGRRLMNIQILLTPLSIYFLQKLYSKRIVIRVRIVKTECMMRINTNTLIIVCFFMIFLPSMLSTGIEKITINSNTMITYKRTAEWLVRNILPDQQALLPLEQIFYFYEPRLKNNTLGYEFIWKEAGVVLKADTTPEELMRVRRTLINYIMSNPNLHFLVLDWMDPITNIFKIASNDELNIILRPVHVERVETGSYRPQIVTYEVVRLKKIYEVSFVGNNSKKQEISSRTYGTCTGTYFYDQEGLTIRLIDADPGSAFRIYMPLREISAYNFTTPYSIAFSLKIKYNLHRDSKAVFTLYFDKNGDNAFDYSNDYVTSFILLPRSDLTTSIESQTLWFSSHSEIGKLIQFAISLESSNQVPSSELNIEDLQIFILCSSNP